MVTREIVEIVEELLAVRQSADRIDPAERMLQLDLCHRHRGQIAQRRHLVGGHGARLVAQHAQRAQTIAIAGRERRAGVETGARTRELARRIIGMVEEIGDHQRLGRLGDFRTRRAAAIEFGIVEADAGFEPLPVFVGQRDRGHRQAKDLAGHPGDPVEALAGGAVEDVEQFERVEPRRFVHRISHDSIVSLMT